MKNLLYIDIDTDREQPILIGKGQDIIPPTTPEEAANMIITDISSLCEALCSLIHISDQSGYATKESLVNESVKILTNMLNTTETPESPASADNQNV